MIGTNAAGTAAIPNGGDGIESTNGATGNTIGGLTTIPGTGAGNLVSGNAGDGVYVDGGGDNLVEGNLIGTDVTGQVAVANGVDGVLANGAPGNTIGGTAGPVTSFQVTLKTEWVLYGAVRPTISSRGT